MNKEKNCKCKFVNEEKIKEFPYMNRDFYFINSKYLIKALEEIKYKISNNEFKHTTDIAYRDGKIIILNNLINDIKERTLIT